MGLSYRNCVVKEQKAGLDNTAIFWLKRMHRHRPGDPQCRVPSTLSPRSERTSGQLTLDVAEDHTEILRKVDSQNITSKYSCVNPKGETKSLATLVYSLRGVNSEKKQISREKNYRGMSVLFHTHTTQVKLHCQDLPPACLGEVCCSTLAQTMGWEVDILKKKERKKKNYEHRGSYFVLGTFLDHRGHCDISHIQGGA